MDAWMDEGCDGWPAIAKFPVARTMHAGVTRGACLSNEGLVEERARRYDGALFVIPFLQVEV